MLHRLRLGDKTTRRSTTGWLCSLFNSTLSYASTTQATGMAESLHLRQIIKEVQTGMGLTTFNYDHRKTITLVTKDNIRQLQVCQVDLVSTLGHDASTYAFSDTRPTTTRKSRHTESDYFKESSRHLHQAMTCSHTTKPLEGQWTYCTCQRRGEDSMYYIENNTDKKHKIYKIKTNNHKQYMYKSVQQCQKRTKNHQQKVREIQKEVLTQRMEIRELHNKSYHLEKHNVVLQQLQVHLTQQHITLVLGSTTTTTTVGTDASKRFTRSSATTASSSR